MNLSGIHLPTVAVVLIAVVVIWFVLHAVAHRA